MEYDISNASEETQQYLPTGYQGYVCRISNNWLPVIPLPITPMKIMEIGAHHGANLCSLLKTYAAPDGSVVHCVDPYVDHDEYYKMINNISKLYPRDLHKIHLYRGVSGDADQFLPPDLYDMIYIDRDHNMRNILEDMVLSMKRIKKGGWIIMDDLQCPDVVNVLQRALPMYDGVIESVLNHSGQLFIHMK